MSQIRASEFPTPEADSSSSFSSPSGSRPSDALEAWRGYAFDLVLNQATNAIDNCWLAVFNHAHGFLTGLKERRGTAAADAEWQECIRARRATSAA